MDASIPEALSGIRDGHVGYPRRLTFLGSAKMSSIAPPSRNKQATQNSQRERQRGDEGRVARGIGGQAPDANQRQGEACR